MFITQVSFFIVLVLILSISSVFFFNNETYITHKVLSDFNHELELIANQFNFKLLVTEEQIKAITSRSMIKKSFMNFT